MDKISKFGCKYPLPILGRFFGVVKITFFPKIGKIHQYSYFGTIYSKKKKKPRYIGNYKVRWLGKDTIFFIRECMALDLVTRALDLYLERSTYISSARLISRVLDL
jgi:hypothetical protein